MRPSRRLTKLSLMDVFVVHDRHGKVDGNAIIKPDYPTKKQRSNLDHFPPRH